MELYSLQVGLAETDQQLFEVRRHWTAIVTHYRRMEWFDVAEQAIAVKADAAEIRSLDSGLMDQHEDR